MMHLLTQKGLAVRLLCTGLLLIAGYRLYIVWSQQIVYYRPITILASREPDLALPVFAQFTVTQTLTVHQPVKVTAMNLPVYLPDGAKPIVVHLQQDGHDLQEWKLPTNEQGIVELELPLSEPRMLQGSLQVFFDGSGIAYDDKEKAPRLFIESEDASYPDGHYAIAQNAKSGDISLSLVAQHTNGEILAEVIQSQPVIEMPKIVLWALLTLLVLSLPWLV